MVLSCLLNLLIPIPLHKLQCLFSKKSPTNRCWSTTSSMDDIIGFYIGLESLGRMFAPAIAGTLGGLIGPVAGRIAGPAVGGVVAAVVGLQTMFIVVPAFSVVLIPPLALRVRGGMINGEN